MRIATCLAGLYLLGIFVTVILQTAQVDAISWLAFYTPYFYHGSLWQALTCTFVNPANFFSLFNILFIGWSGGEVEKYLGRRRFLTLVGVLLLLPPVIVSLWSLAGVFWVYHGSYEFSIGLFIAFVTLYPNLEMFGWITLKWLAFAGILLGSMQSLPLHQWDHLSILWAMCGISFAYIRLLQNRIVLPAWFTTATAFRRKPKFSVVPKPPGRRVVEPQDLYESIDPLLEKISKSGINSLTASERRALDRARNQLLKKSQ